MEDNPVPVVGDFVVGDMVVPLYLKDMSPTWTSKRGPNQQSGAN